MSGKVRSLSLALHRALPNMGPVWTSSARVSGLTDQGRGEMSSASLSVVCQDCPQLLMGGVCVS